jgi:hypothetical protein
VQALPPPSWLASRQTVEASRRKRKIAREHQKPAQTNRGMDTDRYIYKTDAKRKNDPTDEMISETIIVSTDE